MSAFSPFSPVDIRVLSKPEGEAAVLGMLSGQAHKLLVLAPRFLCTELSLAAFLTALQGAGHCVHPISEIPANPSVGDLARLLDALRKQEFTPTCILAIGGGSCMDLAKGISALWHLPLSQTASPQAVRETIRSKAYQQNPTFLDVVAMPTTSGTGSEVTHWATIWDGEQRSKLSIDCPQLFPKAAVLIPDWTVDMPPSLTLSTGLDALSHAMEAFWAKGRTPLSQALALCAIGKVRLFLPQALAEPRSLVVRKEMCMASLLAGLAFSQTRTTACHSISYPLTMLHGIPHGYAAALTLPAVLTRNLSALPEIDQILALFTLDGGLQSWLNKVSQGIQPLTLSAFGIRPEDLGSIADLTFTQGRMDNNPIVFSSAEVMAILRECL